MSPVALPADACNSHCHVVGPRATYAVDESHPMLPPDSPAEALFALQDRLGFSRVVIVQSLAHAFDHSAATDAIRAYGPGARGVALIPPEGGAAEIAQRHAEGYVALRVHVADHIPNHVGPERLAELGALCADVGWHIQIHGHGADMTALLPVLKTLPCRAVIDHMAYPKIALHPDFLRAMDLPHVYAKISCIERVDPTDLNKGATLARDLIARHPTKLVWGNDWPHIGLGPTDDTALVAALATYPPDALHPILVDTPTALYFNEDTL